MSSKSEQLQEELNEPNSSEYNVNVSDETFLSEKIEEKVENTLIYTRFGLVTYLYDFFSKTHPFVSWFIMGLILGIIYQTRIPHVELPEMYKLSTRRLETNSSCSFHTQERLFNLSPMIATSLSLLFDNLMKSYIEDWYFPISKDGSFPTACRMLFDHFSLSFYQHLASKSSYDIMMLFFIQCSNTIIVALRELRSALSFSTDDHNIISVISAYVAQNPGSALSRLLDQPLQRERFRFESENLMKFLGKKEDLDCSILRTLMREMFTVQIFENVVDICSSADFINEWIIYLYDNEKSHETNEEQSQKKSEVQLAMEKAMEEAAEMTKLLQDKAENQESPLSEHPSPIMFNEVITPEKRDYFRRSSVTCFVSPIRSRTSSPDGRHHFKPFCHSKSGSPDRSRLGLYDLKELKPSINAPQDVFLEKDTSSLSKESLFQADISLSYVNSELSPKKIIKSKWSINFLIIVEPAGGQMPGWVIIKKYSDFESLHEVLRRLAAVSGLHSFAKELPHWKNISYEDLRISLENYLRKALKSRDLSDSHAMKSFLDKQSKSDGFSGKRKSWQQLRTVSDGVRDVIKAPATGGRAIINALGAVGRKAFVDIPDNIYESEAENPSTDGLEDSPIVNTDNLLFNASKDDEKPLPPRSSFQSQTEEKKETKLSTAFPNIPDNGSLDLTFKTETCSEELLLEHDKNNIDLNDKKESFSHEKSNSNVTKGFSNSDVQLFIDINFCILSEFYSLSSKTWSIRRSLLGILRSLLLRNGTYVDFVKEAIEEKVTNFFSNEKWISEQINKIIMEIWSPDPAENVEKDSQKLMLKAKRLFLRKTIPDTLKSLVGGTATKESLEIVFNALQEKEFMRGILSSILSDILQVIFQ
ncbi:uncharacterized protein T551_02000 [Pneumocystis jirovecii RU7]|uniref:PXA domain-containing protein n=1 Tax=Pneumocystis jirovecii (strain RU7) TaxID=1408657 RepID=A0A0W4ZNW2_PNEJ7|nr:uncharacterized protein T551_02000 [Pneumocystis jirovecii RU7]KTW30056.1 hypothetical protein T551_02000 [Pneumocystis jirovecii RU7]